MIFDSIADTGYYKAKRLKDERLSGIEPLLILGLLDDAVVLAGGSLRTLVDANEVVKDFDLFIISQDRAEVDDYRDHLKAKIMAAGWSCIFDCEQRELLSFAEPFEGAGRIQVITLQDVLYPSVEALLDSFDINAGRFAIDGFENVYFTRDSLADVRKKNLTLNCITRPVSTILRLSKYAAKGYRISDAARQFVETFQMNMLSGVPMDMVTVYVD